MEDVMWKVEKNINKVWKRMVTYIKCISKKIVGEIRNYMSENIETWWQVDKVQRVIIARKKKQFKL